MNVEPEFLFGDGAIAGFDQVKAAALATLRTCDGFVLITGLDKGDNDLSVVSAVGITEMDAVVFMAIATAEVSKALKQAVLQATGGDELDPPTED